MASRYSMVLWSVPWVLVDEALVFVSPLLLQRRLLLLPKAASAAASGSLKARYVGHTINLCSPT